MIFIPTHRPMNPHHKLRSLCAEAFLKTTGVSTPQIELQPIRPGFAGDLTWLLFPLQRHFKGWGADTAQALGHQLMSHRWIVGFEVVKGFLNLSLSAGYFLEMIPRLGLQTPTPPDETDTIVVEFSSPNTNKPLHLGHIRNILLGSSVAHLLESTSGKTVKRVQIINDRGIHICKSMIAWMRFGAGETPSESLKGDRLVGKYYVRFERAYRAEVAQLQETGTPKEEAEKRAPILLEAAALLQKWEDKDPETLALWTQMNQWVYAGFEKTYRDFGVRFDKNYYESETYLLGKDTIAKGLKNDTFHRREDGSVWVDLTQEKLDQKALLRPNGTSLYITQDLGTAIQRQQDFGFSEMIYTVGSEQDYHFKVLFTILRKLKFAWAERLHHLSYGMVTLPEGRMKSREGTVVDADDLLLEMIDVARTLSESLGKMDGYDTDKKESLYRTIALGALKYHILKVDPKKNIMFNPKESIDFNGNTGPFIQYTYVRIRSLLLKAPPQLPAQYAPETSVSDDQRSLLLKIGSFGELTATAARQRNPALIANFIYDLAKTYNSFYQSTSILSAREASQIKLGLDISEKLATILREGMRLLGIEMPERM